MVDTVTAAVRKRTTRTRSASPVLGLPGWVRVTIGGREEAIEARIEDVQDILRRMHQQPSPIIWRALGIS